MEIIYRAPSETMDISERDCEKYIKWAFNELKKVRLQVSTTTKKWAI